MWRSFFFAVGVGLMLLGVEALIFERISIRPTAKLPKFFNGLYEKSLTDSFALDSRAQLQPFGLNPQVSNPQISNPRQSEFLFSNASSGSQFGPSRFSGPQYGDYGGGRVDLSRSGFTSRANQNAGPNAYPVSFGSQPEAANFDAYGARNYGVRTIVTKDWMPWSLMAIGALIFLYTSSHRRSYGE